ncbi:CBO0543 family protein [Gordoniibacillus kamchatkensis]|uniref:CBO0543 family protein n=1 Tax=Gordoniibacillus kamchatkensis TaxID=1590651 RepID=UPI0018CD7311|nr:CBO0543 family protein [Paenibacillus sp. VKM B-2647]
MERILTRLLTIACVASVPFVFQRKNLLLHLTIFFAKGVLSTCLDSHCIKSKRIEYPVRPFPKVFDTNILYDLFMYPLLSVIWVRWSINDNLKTTLLKSLVFSVPMSIAQAIMEKTTNLFSWKRWSIWHTFVSINFTLFAIRGMVWVVENIIGNNKHTNKNDVIQQKAIDRDEEFRFPFHESPKKHLELENSMH